MKKWMTAVGLLLLCLTLSAMAEGIFVIPSNVSVIEEEAFANLTRDTVLIGKNVTAIGENAFSDRVSTIYGFLDSEAEKYAAQNDISFIPLNVMDISIGADDVWAPQGAEFALTLSATTNIASLRYTLSFEQNGEALYEYTLPDDGARHTYIVREPGTYDIVVEASNGYDTACKRFDGALRIEAPIGFAQENLLVDLNQTKALFSEDETRSVEIVSFDKNLVSVENGQIKGLKTGKAKIEARIVCGENRILTGTCTVTVCKSVTNVSIAPANAHLLPGESTSLKNTIKPTDAGQKQLSYTSSDETIAQVGDDGTVLAVSPGTVNITATAVSGVSGSCEITVEHPVAEVILPETLDVGLDETLTVEATVLPENAYYKNLGWESSDPSVATITNGKLKGIKIGECDIVAYAHNDIGAVCHVRVIKPVKTVKLNKTAVTVDLYANYQFEATVKPDDAFDPTLTWTSSDETIATVDENGLVTTLKAGVCTIKAESVNGISAVCKVTVKETLLTSLGFKEVYVTLRVGDEYATGINVSPSVAQNKDVTYFSSNPAVATVDENGVVHAESTGNTIITATSVAVPSVKNSCKIFVISDNALPLEGVVIGINPGHQKAGINTLYPMAPGSSVKKVGCKVGTQGLKTRTPEYVVALEVGIKLRDILVANGATVIMTRTSNDVYLTNIQRAAILNDANVDAAIQLHCNGGATSAYGMSTYYRTSGDWVEESRWLSTCLLNHTLATTSASNKGVHVCNTYMSLNWSFTPACLIEMGYLTNTQEELKLVDPDYQDQLAWGMYYGLLEYFGR